MDAGTRVGAVFGQTGGFGESRRIGRAADQMRLGLSSAMRQDATGPMPMAASLTRLPSSLSTSLTAQFASAGSTRDGGPLAARPYPRASRGSESGSS